MKRVIRALRAEDGFTLIELLMSSSLMLMVLSATLTTFTGFERRVDMNARQNDAQQAARSTMITLSRQLRNLAGPTANQPGSVDRAGGFDLVFKAVDPTGAAGGANTSNVRRVRFCLGNTVPAKLYMQVQTWTAATSPAIPPDSACPGSGWAQQTLLGSGLSNRRPGFDRPVFLYDSFDLPAIDAIRADLFVDADIDKNPLEVRLESGVFLRNQNRAPTAAFGWTPGGSSRVLLNASASVDPESQPLTYTWKEGSTVIGSEMVLDWSVAAGTHLATLEVRDQAGLVGTTTQTVTVS